MSVSDLMSSLTSLSSTSSRVDAVTQLQHHMIESGEIGNVILETECSFNLKCKILLARWLKEEANKIEPDSSAQQFQLTQRLINVVSIAKWKQEEMEIVRIDKVLKNLYKHMTNEKAGFGPSLKVFSEQLKEPWNLFRTTLQESVLHNTINI
jgi:hypothetical protein